MTKAPLTLRLKQPEDRLDYDCDFSRWLAPGDTIATASAARAAGSGTVTIDDVDFTATTVKVWLDGGGDGDLAHVEIDITTAQGREKQVCFRVRVKDC
jgi:hypothetical protein